MCPIFRRYAFGQHPSHQLVLMWILPTVPTSISQPIAANRIRYLLIVNSYWPVPRRGWKIIAPGFNPGSTENQEIGPTSWLFKGKLFMDRNMPDFNTREWKHKHGPHAVVVWGDVNCQTGWLLTNYSAYYLLPTLFLLLCVLCGFARTPVMMIDV